MTLKHLKIFTVVYQNLNITKAAKLLHMTQPAVSRSIKELEGYYGTCLFDRMNHKLFPTDCGKELYERAMHITNSFDTLEQELKNWDEAGTLRIGASITLGNFIIPDVVARYKKIYPNVEIKVQVSNSANLQKCLLDNTIDLALIEGNISTPNLMSRLIDTDHLCTICPPNHPLKKKKDIYLKDLMEYPLLLREPGSAGRAYIDNVFALQDLSLNPTWESVSTQALVKAVSYNLGISILPFKLIEKDISSHIIDQLTIKDESFIRKNYLVWHKDKYFTKSAKLFIQYCFDFINDNT